MNNDFVHANRIDFTTVDSNERFEMSLNDEKRHSMGEWEEDK